MHAPGELLPAEMTVRGALERFRSSAARTWLVTDLRGVIGVINLSRLEQELAENADRKISDLVDRDRFSARSPRPFAGFGAGAHGDERIEILPVVNRANVHKLEGIVTLAMCWMRTA